MLTQRIQAVQPSSTLKITALAKQLQAQGQQVVNLAAGEPDFDTPAPIKAAAIQAIQEGFTKYTPTTGIPELKKAIQTFFQRDRGLSYRPEQIAVTCGAKQAIYNLLQVIAQAGDEVLIPSPYWVSYPEMVRLAGATPKELRTVPDQGFQLDPEALDRACTPRTRVLILNSPSNPTGTLLTEKTLRGIGPIVLKRGLWVISDEIYSRLLYEGECPSFAALSSELYERTLVVDGVSKTYAMTGWRIGYCAGPAEVIEAVGRLQDHSTSNPASISQRAALAALTGDQSALAHMVGEFKRRRDLLMERLTKIPKVSFVKPEGAFYCFVDISATGLSSAVFCERLLKEAGVALIPGAGFGWDTHARISFVTGADQIREGMDRLDQFIRGL